MAHDHKNEGDDLPIRGGPRTPAGKNASRRNALRHGMAAKTLLPDILHCDLVDEYDRRLRQEWQPATPTEGFLVREMARHEAALVRIQHFEDSVLRRGATGALELFHKDRLPENAIDVALAGAGTSDAVHRLVRYRRSHERGYANSLSTLQALQSHVSRSLRRTNCNRHAFDSSAACRKYLIDRLVRGDAPCPHCQSVQGTLIATRDAWQCRGCKKQRGIRSGTVMEGSRIDLLAWFRAIEALLSAPKMSTAALAAVIDIRRQGTVRVIAQTIRTALDSPDRSRLLAGLERVFVSHSVRS